ncbi:folylpolyglutamate synthase, partial [Exophiala xenobiotica]
MIKLGLQRISALLNPLFTTYPNTLPWKAIHIAGTNGKGSIASLISTFLSNSGYSVGRFTSPHLIDRWDCITLNQRVVERERFLAAEAKVRQRSESDNVGASEFELLTATAFELFTDAKVDVAVVECGLGGRLDATNVLRQGDVLVSVLAKVGLDHTEFLGDTVEKVAREKTGIFKAGVPVVVDGSNTPEVLDVVRERMAALGSSEGGPFVLDEQQSS